MKVQIGTVSEGTVRTDDLLDVFAKELTRLARQEPQNQRHLALVVEAHTLWENFGALTSDEYEDACQMTDDLMDAIQEYCPPFVRFDAHPDDGADFGFWPDMDAIEDAKRDNHSSFQAEHEWILEEDGVILYISDHGNITVMDMDRNELWSVV